MVAQQEDPSEKGMTGKMSLHHRKDLLWKPLLRMFRRYLKNDALEVETYS